MKGAPRRRSPQRYDAGVAGKGNPARLVIALSVAGCLAVFLLYTSIAGGGTPYVEPGKLGKRVEHVQLTGIVVGKPSGDAHGAGLRFRLRDIDGEATVPVVYRGTVPPLFRERRQIVVDGRLRNGVFVADEDSLVTKCPSKYSAEPASPPSR